jgi:hypothetical protein
MQTGKVHRQEVSNCKVFAITTIALLSVLAVPVIIPHITHTDLIYHILVHIASVIVAVFITVISIMSYRRNGGSRLFFMTAGFAVLAFVEFLYLFYATANIEAIIIPLVDIESSHIILLVMLTLFGIGVLKVDR